MKTDRKCVLHLDSFTKEINIDETTFQNSKFNGIRHLLGIDELKVAKFIKGEKTESVIPEGRYEIMFYFGNIDGEGKAHYFLY